MPTTDVVWNDEFVLDHDVLYLNHAAVAPWPTRTRDAVIQFASENAQIGAQHYPAWLKVEQQCRERLAWLIGGVPVDDIAMLKNTSEGLSVIAQGLSWQAGDRIIITDQEFPSNRIPWQALIPQGVDVVAVPIDGPDPEGDLIRAMDDSTRLLSVSAVQYGSGMRLDLARLGQACQARGIRFCVDAIQQLGALPLDAEAIHADYIVADGHKWLLGPEGLALFYCRGERQAELTLRQHGWHMVKHAGDYDRKDWQPADNAKRFECGSPNMLGIHALNASLSLFQDVGMDLVSKALNANIDYLLDGLALKNQLQLLSPEDAARRAGIVTVKRVDEIPELTYQRLKSAGVICALRGGGVRLSPHFYTPFEVLDRALAVL